MPTDGVGPGVADHASLDRRQPTLGVAPGPVLQPDGMALGVHEQRLLAGQGALHGPTQQPGGQGGVRLVAHVLLAAEGPAVGHQLDADAVGRQPQHRGDLVAVVPHALATRVHVQPAVGAGHGQGRLGLQESVLDALRLEDLVTTVGAGARRPRATSPRA